MAVELQPFAEEHLDAAAELLAARHRRQRAVEPALAARFEDPAATRVELEALWRTDHASGAVCLRAGRVSGFLLGTRRSESPWGPNVWVEAAGHAVEEAEDARDLYAFAAARWVEEGRTSHYAVVPASDGALVDAWFRLGFGLQHVHALRELEGDPASAPPEGVVVRRPVREDIPELARIDLVLPRHHGGSPVFSAGGVETVEELVADWERDFDDERFTTFVAEIDGRVVGSATVCRLELSSAHAGMAFVDGAAFLAFAALDPEWRFRGVGTALYQARVAHAGRAGHRTLVTDFRAANLLSSRFFGRRRFRPTFSRLFRAIV